MRKQILLLILLAFCCTGCKSRTQSAEQENCGMETIQITDFLAGTWVNELGFICEYDGEHFTDQFGNFYEDCEVSNYKKTDFYIIECNDPVDTKTHKIVIQVMDKDTIQVDAVTAYRADCPKAREYIENMKKNIIGTWTYISEEDEQSMEFTKDELITMEEEYEERAKYELSDAKLLVHLGEDDIMTIYIQLDGDELTLQKAGQSILAYRRD